LKDSEDKIMLLAKEMDEMDTDPDEKKKFNRQGSGGKKTAKWQDVFAKKN
jgi:hypothetical protein